MGYGGGTTVFLLFLNLIQYLGGGGIGIGWKLENIIHNTTTNKYPDGRLALHQPVMQSLGWDLEGLLNPPRPSRSSGHSSSFP